MAKAKQKTDEPEIVIRKRVVLDGIGEASRRLGVSRAHLSYVVRGERESNRTWQRMRERNIRVEI